MRRNSLLILVACLGLACSDEDADSQNSNVGDVGPDVADVGADLTDVPVVLGERTRAGRWMAGDFHVHATGASNDTGGDSSPERIREVAMGYGLDFVVLTDHSNSTGSDTTTTEEDETLFNLGPEFPLWSTAAMLSGAGFLMIDGNEMSPVADGARPSTPTGHIGCYPRDLDTFDPSVAFTDRPRGTVDGAATIAQARAAGCYVTVNHPFGPAPWISFDWTTRDYDALEVFNGSAGWDQFDHQAMLGYFCDISNGKKVAAIGGSDNHRVNTEPPGTITDPVLGSPTTYVFSETELNWSGIVKGLDQGWTSVSDTGSPLELDVYDAQGAWLAMPGDEFSAADGAWMKVSGTLEGTSEDRVLRVVEIVPDACDDTRMEGVIQAPVPVWNVVFEKTLDATGGFEERLAFEAKAGHAYVAWLRPEAETVIMKHGVAFTGALLAK